MVCRLGLLDPCISIDLPLGNLLHFLFKSSDGRFFALVDDLFILLDSFDYGVVGLLLHHCVGVSEPLIIRCIILYYRIIDNRRSMIVIDDSGIIYVGYPDLCVVVRTKEIGLVDHNSMVGVSIIPDIDIDLGHADAAYDHFVRSSPVVVAIIGFTRGQRHPSHVSSAVKP